MTGRGRLLFHGPLQTGRWDERDRFERSMAQVDPNETLTSGSFQATGRLAI